MLYVNKKEVDALGLPRKWRDIREDGYIFTHYYRNKPDGNVLEFWLSPSSWVKRNKRKVLYQKNYLKRNKAILRRYKTRYGCVLCGYKKHPDAIHFDHIDPNIKSREISTMASYGIKAIKKEIKKCRLLCANCHAVHTSEQRKV